MPKPVRPKKRDRIPRSGWREWVRLPDLGAGFIKAKLDTGARTSALHAFDIEHVVVEGRDVARFMVCPRQDSRAGAFRAEAPILDERMIRSSTGHQRRRIVVATTLTLGESSWPIELTLASRDEMGFRLLLGRTAIKGHVLVDSGRSFVRTPRIPGGSGV